jgi:hypothetical protein
MRVLLLAIFALLALPDPASAGPVVGLLAGLAAKAFAAITLKSVTLMALKMVLSAGVSLLLQKYRQSKQRPAGIQTSVTTSGGTDPQGTIVGLYATGGHLTYRNSHGVNRRFLTHVIEVSDLPGVQFGRLIIDGEYSALGTTEHADYGYPILSKNDGTYDRGWLRFVDGTHAGADAGLVARYSADPDRPWTTNHILSGVAHFILTFDQHRPSYPNGVPQVRFEMIGIQLYDPRLDDSVGGTGAHRWADTTTWATTTNPIVIAYNIHRGLTLPSGEVWGGDAESEDLPLDSWSPAMNACDQMVGTPARKRFQCGFEIRFNEQPADVLDEIYASANAQVAELGGVWRVQVGAPAAAIMQITDADIIVTKAQQFDPFPGIEQTFNAISVAHPSRPALWNTTGLGPITNAQWEAEDGERNLFELKLPAVPWQEQARQLAQTLIRDQRRFRSHAHTLPPDYFQLEPLDSLDWTSAWNSYSAKAFGITQVAYDLRTLLIAVSSREHDPSDYTFDETLDFPEPPKVTGALVVTDAGVPGFNAVGIELQDEAGQDRRPGVKLIWDTSIDKTVEALTFEIRLAGGVDLAFSASTSEVASGQYISGEVLPNTSYEAHAKAISGTRVTAWTAWKPFSTQDIRFGSDDIATSVTQTITDAQDRADAAFVRHDVTVANATGALAELRDLTIASFGPLGVPVALADQVELAYGPLSVSVSISDRLDIEVDRLNIAIPQVRAGEEFQDRMWQQMIQLQSERLLTDQRLADAGIFVDPDSGLVRIAATEATDARLSNVEIIADAQGAEIALRATVGYVDQTVSNAVLDPTQLPVITGLVTQVSSLELTLNAETGRIDILDNLLTVDGAKVSMATVGIRLDNVEQDLTLRVTSTDFDAEVTRINGVEQTLTTLGDVSSLKQSVTASRSLAGDLGDLTETGLADLWEAYDGRTVIRTAEAGARREMRAFVDTGFAAEASDRAQLSADLETAVAQIETESKVRIADGAATASTLTQLQVDLDDVDSNLSGTVAALDSLTGRVGITETGLSAEGARVTFLGVSVRDLDFDAEDTAQRSIADIWDSWATADRVRAGVAVSMQSARTRVDDGLLAEAAQRAVLGAALDEATASITAEKTARASADAALVESISQLSATIDDPVTGLAKAHGEITELNRVDVTSTSVLVQAHVGLAAAVNDPATGLAAATGEITELNTVDATSTSALVQAHRGLDATVSDPVTGLAAATGAITELNTVDATSGSALVQAHRGLDATVNDPVTGLAAATGAITELNTVDATSSSALVQAHRGLEATVNDPATGLAAATGEITELNTVDATSTSALVQAHRGLDATVSDPVTGLAAATGAITELNTVDATSGSALVQAHRGLDATVNDPVTGLAANVSAVSSLSGRVTANEGGLSALVSRADILEAGQRAGQVLVNGDFAAGDLRGWSEIPAAFSVASRLAGGDAAVQTAPSPFVLAMAQDAAAQRGRVAASIPVVPGDGYDIRLMAAGVAGGSASLSVRFQFYDADGTYLTYADRNFAVPDATWITPLLATVTVPPGAATANIYLRRNAGGTGPAYATQFRVDRVTASEADALARVATIETAYVDAAGAIAAVEQEISADYAGLAAMANATAFAKASADGISAGYLWRLNGANVMELVAVNGGTGGAQVTAKIDADYVRISGLTQIDDAVIAQMAVSTALVDNLTVANASVGTLQLAGNAVTVPARYFRGDFVDITSPTSWKYLISVNIDRQGFATDLTFSASLDGYGNGIVEIGFFRDGVLMQTAHQSTAPDGRQSQISVSMVDFNTGLGVTAYTVSARKVSGTLTGGWNAQMRVFKRLLRAVQFQR